MLYHVLLDDLALIALVDFVPAIPATLRLQEQGIIVKNSVENVKALADRYEITPFSIANLIQAGTSTLEHDEKISAGG